ncbi:MAG: MFS transporter [Deltaproteobacteria bacterium]|nr:MFS transporter [Deltaproteobacteria bacterium]
MRFPIKESLSPVEIENGLKAVLKDGVASSIMSTLTGGVFLVAFAVKLGASNALIGLLVALLPLAQILQLPSIILVEKIRNRRAITVTACLLSRSAWFVAALTPLLLSPSRGVAILIAVVAFHALFFAVSNCSWNSWMRDLVPQQSLGAFFSKRLGLVMASGLIASLIAGLLLDVAEHVAVKGELFAYAFLFGMGGVAGLAGVYFLSRIPEPRLAPSLMQPFKRAVIQPFRDPNFRQLIFSLGGWNFAVNLAVPFLTVYMLNQLHLNLTTIIALTALNQAAYLKSLKGWGKISDRWSNKSVLAICGPFYLLSLLAWTFTTLPDKHLLTLPLLIVIHVTMGISMAGITLASGNIGLKLAPSGQATSYLATKNFVNSIAAGIAPILGGAFADTFTSRELSWTLRWTSPGGEVAIEALSFEGFDFFFFTAFLIGLYALSRLALVKEVGEVKEQIIWSEFFAFVKRMGRHLAFPRK